MKNWVDWLEAPVGIGVDMAEIAKLEDMDVRTNGAFVQRTFTEKEREEAEKSPDRWSYLAGRFAVKEAVFKALAPLHKTFDFRIVETLREPDGSPRIQPGEALESIMYAASVERLLVSITNEGGFALAFAIAVRTETG